MRPKAASPPGSCSSVCSWVSAACRCCASACCASSALRRSSASAASIASSRRCMSSSADCASAALRRSSLRAACAVPVVLLFLLDALWVGSDFFAADFVSGGAADAPPFWFSVSALVVCCGSVVTIFLLPFKIQNNSKHQSPGCAGTKSFSAIGTDLPSSFTHLLAARLSLLLRSSDASSPAPNQIRLRIDHPGCRVLPELDQILSRFRSNSRLWSEIDLPCRVEPTLPETTLSLSPVLQLLTSFPHHLTKFLGGSLSFGQCLGPLLGPLGSRINGLFHRGLPGIYRFPP